MSKKSLVAKGQGGNEKALSVVNLENYRKRSSRIRLKSQNDKRLAIIECLIDTEYSGEILSEVLALLEHSGVIAVAWAIIFLV